MSIRWINLLNLIISGHYAIFNWKSKLKILGIIEQSHKIFPSSDSLLKIHEISSFNVISGIVDIRIFYKSFHEFNALIETCASN